MEAEEIARVAVPSNRGRSDVALGNIVGTIVHFIAFNAGVIALVQPLELDGVTLRLHLPVAAGSVALVTIVLMIQKRVSRRLGAMLALGYLVYVAVAVGLALR